MHDVLRYAGKRVIVTGAASRIGTASAKLLVELGAEVHALDARKPDLPGLASFTETDLRDRAQIDAAADRIGSIVNALFHCAAGDVERLVERVVPLMVEGSAVGGVAFDDEVVAYTAAHAAALAAHGVRINCVRVGATEAEPEHQAWPLIFLNSPRAAYVTGVTLAVDPSASMPQP